MLFIFPPFINIYHLSYALSNLIVYNLMNFLYNQYKPPLYILSGSTGNVLRRYDQTLLARVTDTAAIYMDGLNFFEPLTPPAEEGSLL